MAKKREKLDTSQERNPLHDTPFAHLLSPVEGTPEKTPPDATVTTSRPYFTISRTKKGGFHIHVEKRGGGKCVTVVAGLAGDLPRLLKHLRKMCGGGGTIRDNAIELQGDHREKLESFFRNPD